MFSLHTKFSCLIFDIKKVHNTLHRGELKICKTHAWKFVSVTLLIFNTKMSVKYPLKHFFFAPGPAGKYVSQHTAAYSLENEMNISASVHFW